MKLCRTTNVRNHTGNLERTDSQSVRHSVTIANDKAKFVRSIIIFNISRYSNIFMYSNHLE